MDKKRNSVRPHVVLPNPPAPPTSGSNVRPSDEGCDCLLYSCPKKHHNSDSTKRGIASGASINRSSTIKLDVEPGLPKIPAPSGGSNVSAPDSVNMDVLPQSSNGSAFNDVVNAIYVALDDMQRRADDYLRKIEKIQSGRTQAGERNLPGIPARARVELFGANTAMEFIEDVNLVAPVMWMIDDALMLVREMRPKCIAHGYTMELGGSVLQHGFSTNDLDLVLVPRSDMLPCPESTIIWLFESAGWKFLSKSERGPLQILHISRNGKLIDLIFVQVAASGKANEHKTNSL